MPVFSLGTKNFYHIVFIIFLTKSRRKAAIIDGQTVKYYIYLDIYIFN